MGPFRPTGVVLLIVLAQLANSEFVKTQTKQVELTSATSNRTNLRIGWKYLGLYLTGLSAAAIAAGAIRTTTTTTTPSTVPIFPTGLPTASPPSLILGTIPPAGQVTDGFTTNSGTSLVQCYCVQAGTCVSNNAGTNGFIDIRIVTPPPNGVQCPSGQQYCCFQGVPPTSIPNTGCGRQSIINIPGTTVQAGQASFGEYPWSAILMTTSANQYVGGGALIDSIHVLTVAHNVAGYPNGAGLKVRLGDWNLQNTNEPFRHIDINVAQIVIHPNYNAGTLQNDLAIITMSSAVSLGSTNPQIGTVCLPPTNGIFTGQRCWVAGWGRDNFNGNFQYIEKEVDVPILGSVDCQTKLRATRLGPSFNLDASSFICAGGEFSKDSCTGDGGSALVCLQNNQWVVVGLTSWGIGCATTNVPGVYVNVVNYIPWITQQIGGTGLPPIGGIDPRVSSRGSMPFFGTNSGQNTMSTNQNTPQTRNSQPSATSGGGHPFMIST